MDADSALGSGVSSDLVLERDLVLVLVLASARVLDSASGSGADLGRAFCLVNSVEASKGSTFSAGAEVFSMLWTSVAFGDLDLVDAVSASELDSDVVVAVALDASVSGVGALVGAGGSDAVAVRVYLVGTDVLSVPSPLLIAKAS